MSIALAALRIRHAWQWCLREQTTLAWLAVAVALAAGTVWVHGQIHQLDADRLREADQRADVAEARAGTLQAQLRVVRAERARLEDSISHVLERSAYRESGAARLRGQRLAVTPVASTLGPPTVHDTLEAVRRERDLAVAEADSLLAALGDVRVALHLREEIVVAQAAALDSAHAVIAGLLHSNEELRAIARRGSRCRVLPFVPCPSRTVAAAGGAAAGVLLTLLLLP